MSTCLSLPHYRPQLTFAHEPPNDVLSVYLNASASCKLFTLPRVHFLTTVYIFMYKKFLLASNTQTKMPSIKSFENYV